MIELSMTTMLPDFVQLRWNALICRVISFGLVLVLTACSSGAEPPRSAVLKALSLQIQLTQRSISRTLDLPEPAEDPTVSRVRIEDQQTVLIGEQGGVKIKGRFDWQLPGDTFQVDSPFEIYLERGDLGESWRLARPTGSQDGLSQDWLTFPLPLS